MTEKKLDETRQKNILPHEVSDSIFTTALEKVMNNVGLTMPYDSDPNFYKDHYEN